ncbi:MAG: hypothetical protein HEQ23_09355 [Tepidisphaera sp.]
MGLLSDFFFAPAQAPDSDILEHGPKPPLPRFESKSLTGLELATLHTILLGESLADIEAVVSRSPDPIAHASEEGPWLFPIDDQLIELLRKVPASERPALADAWGRTEEMKVPPGDPDFQAWFASLCTFLTQPRPASDRCWLWVCL